MGILALTRFFDVIFSVWIISDLFFDIFFNEKLNLFILRTFSILPASGN